MTAASRSLATALWGARFASGLLQPSYTSWDTTAQVPNNAWGVTVDKSKFPEFYKDCQHQFEKRRLGADRRKGVDRRAWGAQDGREAVTPETCRGIADAVAACFCAAGENQARGPR